MKHQSLSPTNRDAWPATTWVISMELNAPIAMELEAIEMQVRVDQIKEVWFISSFRDEPGSDDEIFLSYDDALDRYESIEADFQNGEGDFSGDEEDEDDWGEYHSILKASALPLLTRLSGMKGRMWNDGKEFASCRGDLSDFNNGNLVSVEVVA